MSDDNKSFEDIIVDIESKRVQLEKDSLDMLDAKKNVELKETELRSKLDKIESQKKRVLDEANEEAAKILENAKADADSAIKKINALKSNNDNINELEKVRQNLGKKAKKAREKTAEKKRIENHSVPKNLKIGDPVKVLSMNKKAAVLSIPDKSGNLKVQMGIMKIDVNIRDLVLMEEKDELAEKYGYASNNMKKKSKKQEVTINKSGSASRKAYDTSYEIKLLGLTSDEAINELDKYLDDAFLANIPSVRIVHGKGTGVLRQTVQQYLRRHPNISEFHLGEFGEGDSGVTIATFR